MKNLPFALLLSVVSLATSCTSYNQFAAGATGAGLGGMFGSAIGGLSGGPRGADRGQLVGMVAGAVAGAAIGGQLDEQANRSTAAAPGHAYDKEAPVSYDTYTPRTYVESSSSAAYNDLEVVNVRYLDPAGHRFLSPGKEAFIEMDIYNRGTRILRGVAPVISCDNKRIRISPTAIISEILPGQGVRYRAAVRTGDKLKAGQVRFTVQVGGGSQPRTVKSFTLETRKR